jgi:predicted NBD/HSP70 family sugar kinase
MQPEGAVCRHDTRVHAEGSTDAVSDLFHLERLIKFLLWSRGGCRVLVAGAPQLTSRLADHYRQSVTGRFDAQIMGERIYEAPFEVLSVDRDDLPAVKPAGKPLGRHLDGCRIGFDLGASDRKVAAVVDGEVVFSNEVEWDPVPQTDPQWHFDQIMDSLQQAAARMPRVDAIGGSSAGVYVGNRVMVASLFRGVPAPLFENRVKGVFRELREAWGNIPFEVVNDGEVTALAGSMALNANGVLGVAMGSSEAAGYVTPAGTITNWLNELAFAPIDYAPEAPADEWSGDRGCGVQYLSQQAVARLMPIAGLATPADMPLPERLKVLQERMSAGDERACKVYQTIGVYLGYAVAHYARFYEVEHVLVLGRVTSGAGGDVILQWARDVLDTDSPEMVQRIALRTPDERNKRHGQAIAAASLPAIP